MLQPGAIEDLDDAAGMLFVGAGLIGAQQNTVANAGRFHVARVEAAWLEAVSWWREEVGGAHEPVGIGVEVSTASGDWRTVRHPGR